MKFVNDKPEIENDRFLLSIKDTSDIVISIQNYLRPIEIAIKNSLLPM